MSFVVLLCLFAQLLLHVRSASITFDEGPHLATGYTTLRTGDLRLQPVHIHPPLANVLAAAPLLLQDDLPDPRQVDGWEIASLSAVTDAVVWRYAQPARMAFVSRLPIVLMTLALAALVYRWAADLFGRWGGLVAVTLLAFDPNVVAHGSLVTTDMAVALWGTALLWLTARYLRRGRWGYLVGASAMLGLALASKVSAVSLLPVAGLLWLLGPSKQPLRQRVLAAGAAFALAGLIVWAAYGLELRPVDGLPVPLPAATHVDIFRSLQEHYDLGHPAFLLGQNSDRGWLAYFPLAFLLKTPLPILLLLSLLTLTALRRLPSAIRNLQSANPQSAICNLPICNLPICLFPLLYLTSSLFSSVNIGYRHLLPVLPCLYILTGALVAPRPVPHAGRTATTVAVALLLATLVVGSLAIAPHYLAFFNPIAGGPENGYRALVDSNLDWGQSLWELREWMADHGIERVYYAHFSPARPEVYGVNVDFLPPDPRAVDFTPFDPAPGVYAIGATVLQGVYAPDVNTYAWFRTHEPLARLGHALFVYRVPERPAPNWIALCTGAAAPESLRAAFGNPHLRVAPFDCEQSWLYPAEGGPGAWVLAPGAPPPPGSALDVRARLADGSAAFEIYTGDGRAIPERPASDTSIEGPLGWIGCRVPPAVYAGEQVEFDSYWQVTGVVTCPFSLMAHLAGPDGGIIDVADGLGVPVDGLQPGDVIVQRHRFAVPSGTQGELTVLTGAYCLDTMERWPVYRADGTVGDQIVAARIQSLSLR